VAAKIVKAFDSMRSLFRSLVLQQLVVPAILFSNFHGFFPSQLHSGCAAVRPETASFTAFLTSGRTSSGFT